MAGPGTAHGRGRSDGGVGGMVLFLSFMALATGLVAGVFYGFSDFLMRALRAIPVPQGAAAMISINRVILRASFVPLLLGLGPLAIGGAAWAHLEGALPGTAWLWSATIAYLVGVLGVTVLCNVPLNDRLAQAPDPTALWLTYARRWTRWNTLRTLASGIASLCYMQAALAIVGQSLT